MQRARRCRRPRRAGRKPLRMVRERALPSANARCGERNVAAARAWLREGDVTGRRGSATAADPLTQPCAPPSRAQSSSLMPIRAAFAVTLLAGAASAQGAVLDVLDGETLYDGGFLLTLGQEIARKEVLRRGSERVTDPFASHETLAETTLALQYGLRHDLQLGIAASWVDHQRDTVAGALGADGFGDLDLMAKYRFLRFDGVGFATNFALLGGVSLPTGDDDEPAAGLSLPSGGGGSELEPSLQPGSGGIDPWLGVGVTHEPGRWRFNAATMYQ